MLPFAKEPERTSYTYRTASTTPPPLSDSKFAVVTQLYGAIQQTAMQALNAVESVRPSSYEQLDGVMALGLGSLLYKYRESNRPQ